MDSRITHYSSRIIFFLLFTYPTVTLLWNHGQKQLDNLGQLVKPVLNYFVTQQVARFEIPVTTFAC